MEISGHTRARLRLFLDKAERVYLLILRSAILIIATICLAWALWLAISGVIGVSRNAASVSEVEARVSAEEIAAARDLDEQGAKPAEKKDPQSAERAYYADYAKRYHILFRTAFETYRQGTDKPLSAQDFDSRFLGSANRLEAIARGDLIFSEDKRDLEMLLTTMQAAAALPATKERLTTYKRSPRQRVERKVSGTRTERYCSYYGYYIGECITYDTRQVPYTETRVSMELPKGVVTYERLFYKYQEEFHTLLNSRRETHARAAAEQRDKIVAGNITGRFSLWTAVQVLGSFLILMFFFLLIAIERHQRRLATRLAPEQDDKSIVSD